MGSDPRTTVGGGVTWATERRLVVLINPLSNGYGLVVGIRFPGAAEIIARQATSASESALRLT
jgi:hypothetical protein